MTGPDFIDMKIGQGGFLGRIHLRHPTPWMKKSLPKLRELERPAYVIWGLHVHPLRRGQGWAGALLVNAQRIARLLHHDLYLWVRPYGNLPDKTKAQLQSLYRRFGFERVATTDESWYFWQGRK